MVLVFPDPRPRLPAWIQRQNLSIFYVQEINLTITDRWDY